MWQSRRWRHLLNIIDGLPRNSAYHEALSNDIPLARMLSALPERKGGPIRRMREFSAEVEVLSVCADRLAELIQAVGATKGAKPKAIRLMPRPVTASQRLAARRRKAKHDSIVARMLPNRGKSTPALGRAGGAKTARAKPQPEPHEAP